MQVRADWRAATAAMLSLDEPLDLKLPRRVNGRDRGPRAAPLSPLHHAKRARQLYMADDGTAVIEPASPESPHSGRSTDLSVSPQTRGQTLSRSDLGLLM